MSAQGLTKMCSRCESYSFVVREGAFISYICTGCGFENNWSRLRNLKDAEPPMVDPEFGRALQEAVEKDERVRSGWGQWLADLDPARRAALEEMTGVKADADDAKGA